MNRKGFYVNCFPCRSAGIMLTSHRKQQKKEWQEKGEFGVTFKNIHDKMPLE